jgi:hypothetical protein
VIATAGFERANHLVLADAEGYADAITRAHERIAQRATIRVLATLRVVATETERAARGEQGHPGDAEPESTETSHHVSICSRPLAAEVSMVRRKCSSCHAGLTGAGVTAELTRDARAGVQSPLTRRLREDFFGFSGIGCGPEPPPPPASPPPDEPGFLRLATTVLLGFEACDMMNS